LIRRNGGGADVHLIVLLHLLVLHSAAVALHSVLEEEEQLFVGDVQAVQIALLAVFGWHLLTIHALIVVLLQPCNARRVGGEGRLVHFEGLSRRTGV
jgi:hypothetical protein